MKLARCHTRIRHQIQMIYSNDSNKRQHKVSLIRFIISFRCKSWKPSTLISFSSLFLYSLTFDFSPLILNLFGFFFYSGVTAEYSNNELLFVYKNLVGNRNMSSPIGIYEGRRSAMSAEHSKRSPISADIQK